MCVDVGLATILRCICDFLWKKSICDKASLNLLLSLKELNDVIDTWVKELDNYDIKMLSAKPSANNWSLGQLYNHLVSDTSFYIEQIKTCLSSKDDVDKEMTPFAKELFSNNRFPDGQINGDPSNEFIPQPQSLDYLKDELSGTRKELNHLYSLIIATAPTAKTEHPGLGYFNASEWLRFATIHFQHHLRQKERIDDYLKTQLRHK